MKKRKYLKPCFDVFTLQKKEVLSDSNTDNGVGQPVPPISDGGTYN